jgi:hypothetical protein
MGSWQFQNSHNGFMRHLYNALDFSTCNGALKDDEFNAYDLRPMSRIPLAGNWLQIKL